RLNTWDLGKFKGKQASDWNNVEKEYVENPDKQIEGGESFNQFKHRIIDAFKDVAKHSVGNSAIGVSSKAEALIKAWEKAGKQGYEIDNNTYLNYKENRETPTTLTRGDLLGKDTIKPENI